MEGLSRRQETPPFHLLPVGVWSAIGSYADALEAECDGRNPSSLSALRCASGAFRSLLTSESYYRARVADEIREWNDIDDSGSFRFRDEATLRCPSAASVGGNENLLNIVAAYGPLRGWYRLRGSCDARPWELLVRVEFSGGRLCGHHVAPEEDADLRAAVSAAQGPVLDITFGRNGRVQCKVIGKTAEGFCFRVKPGGSPRPCKWNGIAVDCRPRDFYRSRQTMHPTLVGRDGSASSTGLNKGPTLQVYDVLKDSASDASTTPPHDRTPASSGFIENNGLGFISNARAPAAHRTPSAMIERMLEHKIPLCGYRSMFRRSPSTNRFESYYPNELHFEYICGPGSMPSAISSGGRSPDCLGLDKAKLLCSYQSLPKDPLD